MMVEQTLPAHRPMRGRRDAGRGSSPPVGDELWTLRPAKLWRWLKRQPASFWFLSLYLVFEYLHPQIIYPVINVLPWGYTLMALSALSLLLEGRGFSVRTVIGGGMAFYTLVVLASSVTAWRPSSSIEALPHYFDWVWAYLLITNIVRTEKQFFGFMVLYMLCSFKMSLFGARSWTMRGFSFADWGVTGSPVWFQNSGEFGVQLCIFFPISVGFYLALRKYWGKWTRLLVLSFPVTAMMSIIASSSRGALVGAGLVLAWMVARSRHRVRAALAGVVVAALVYFAVPPEQKARFDTAGEDANSIARLTVWQHGREMAADHPVLGIGYGNWSDYSVVYYGRALVAHNVFIEALGEMGYLGLTAFLVLIVSTFVVNYRTRRLVARLPGDRAFQHQMALGFDGALIGFLGSGFFVTVLYYPFLWVNLALTVALHLTAQNAAQELKRGPRRPAGAPLRPVESQAAGGRP